MPCVWPRLMVASCLQLQTDLSRVKCLQFGRDLPCRRVIDAHVALIRPLWCRSRVSHGCSATRAQSILSNVKRCESMAANGRESMCCASRSVICSLLVAAVSKASSAAQRPKEVVSSGSRGR